MTERPTPGPIRAVKWVNSTAIAAAAGDIDLASSSDFQRDLLALLAERPKRIIVDLSAVGYMDSSGVASLVKLLSRGRRYGTSLALAGLTQRVRSIFEITRLSDIFDIRQTAEAALVEWPMPPRPTNNDQRNDQRPNV